MEKEIWKQVKSYEGLYEVSSLGNVKRVGSFRGVNKMYLNDYYLKHRDNGKGYSRVKLTKENKSKMLMVHRLVAEAFIENPENKKCVNHKNLNKKDNYLSNLEWNTHSENTMHYSNNTPLSKQKIRKTKGYTYSEKDNLYISRIGIDCKTIVLGYFKTKEEAIKVYNDAYIKKIEYLKQKN
jgi:hypothetical protein